MGNHTLLFSALIVREDNDRYFVYFPDFKERSLSCSTMDQARVLARKTLATCTNLLKSKNAYALKPVSVKKTLKSYPKKNILEHIVHTTYWHSKPTLPNTADVIPFH